MLSIFTHSSPSHSCSLTRNWVEVGSALTFPTHVENTAHSPSPSLLDKVVQSSFQLCVGLIAPVSGSFSDERSQKEKSMLTAADNSPFVEVRRTQKARMALPVETGVIYASVKNGQASGRHIALAKIVATDAKLSGSVNEPVSDEVAVSTSPGTSNPGTNKVDCSKNKTKKNK